MRVALLRKPSRFDLPLVDYFTGAKHRRHEPGEATFQIIQSQIVTMGVARNVYPKQSRFDHDFEVV